MKYKVTIKKHRKDEYREALDECGFFHIVRPVMDPKKIQFVITTKSDASRAELDELLNRLKGD